jgi:hypothetical protein
MYKRRDHPLAKLEKGYSTKVHILRFMQACINNHTHIAGPRLTHQVGPTWVGVEVLPVPERDLQ